MFQDGQKNILCKIASYYNICFDPKFYHISKNILIYTDLTDILSYFKRNFDKYRRYDEFPKHHAFPLCEQ